MLDIKILNNQRLIMMNRRQICLTSTLLVLFLGACSSPSETSSQSPDSATPAVSPSNPEAKTNDPQKVIATMEKVLGQTEKFVKANQFDKANETYKDFDPKYWEKIEDGVKEKSKETYKQVEDGMPDIANNLKAPKPNTAKTIASIQSLKKILATYAKSL